MRKWVEVEVAELLVKYMAKRASTVLLIGHLPNHQKRVGGGVSPWVLDEGHGGEAKVGHS